VKAVRFLPEDLQEARYIPTVRYLMLVVTRDADEGTQVIVATQFCQASLEVNVAQRDGEQHHAPQNTDRMIVPAVATCLAETVE
jgi:hypothetical protein